MICRMNPRFKTTPAKATQNMKNLPKSCQGLFRNKKTFPIAGAKRSDSPLWSWAGIAPAKLGKQKRPTEKEKRRRCPNDAAKGKTIIMFLYVFQRSTSWILLQLLEVNLRYESQDHIPMPVVAPYKRKSCAAKQYTYFKIYIYINTLTTKRLIKHSQQQITLLLSFLLHIFPYFRINKSTNHAKSHLFRILAITLTTRGDVI